MNDELTRKCLGLIQLADNAVLSFRMDHRHKVVDILDRDELKLTLDYGPFLHLPSRTILTQAGIDQKPEDYHKAPY